MKRLVASTCVFALLIPSLVLAGNGGWGNHGHYRGSHYSYGHHGGGHDGSDLLAGIVIGGLTYWVVDTITESQRPVVVYQQPQVVYQSTYAPQDYARSNCQAPPSNPSPQCQKYVGYPEYLAACERGAAEFREEERGRLEQEAYETGRKGLPK